MSGLLKLEADESNASKEKMSGVSSKFERNALSGLQGSVRRLLIAAAFVTPAAVASCTLDTQGTGLFDPTTTPPDAAQPETSPDSMVISLDSGDVPDSTIFPTDDAGSDADAADDADAMMDVDAMMDAMGDADADMMDAPDVKDAPSDSPVDAPIDAPADAPIDAIADAPADAPPDAPSDAGPDSGDAGLVCGTTGDVVFDPKMSCYVEGLYRSGAFLPAPDSSPGGVCEKSTCANTPVGGDIEALWVQETKNTGLYTSVTTPTSYTARCITYYTSATPPTLAQLKTEIGKSTGWFVPVVSKSGTSYTLDAPGCAGSSVLYLSLY